MTFTVVVSVVMVLGALVMALVLLLTGAPTALVVGAVLAAVPVGPLVAIFMWLDRYEPEPRSLLLLALGWGAFVATSFALLLQLLASALLELDDVLTSAVVAPVTEEATKGLFVLLLLWFRRHELDGVLDGLVVVSEEVLLDPVGQTGDADAEQPHAPGGVDLGEQRAGQP